MMSRTNRPTPKHRPKISFSLIAMKGHPATGKSAVARRLAHRLHMPLIDKDDIKDYVLGLAGANDIAYDAMWQIVETQLSLRIAVIAVSPLSYPQGYARACEISAKFRAKLLVVETVLEETEWQRRLDARTPGYSTHKISGWAAMQEMLRQYDGCWQYPIAAEHHLVLDTTQPIDVSVNAIIERLEMK